MTECARVVEALLFLSPEPLGIAELAAATQTAEAEIEDAIALLSERFAPGRGGIVLRELSGGLTLATDPVAEDAARRIFGRDRRPTLSQAQAETLAIVAYLQPISRPEIARIRGVSADWAVTALQDRDLIEESGRSQFGATLYRTTPALLRYLGLSSLDELPDIASWDPTPQEAGELRERLLRAGEARAGAGGGDGDGALASAPVLDLDAEASADGGGEGEAATVEDGSPVSSGRPAQGRPTPMPDEPALGSDAPSSDGSTLSESASGLPVDRWERELLLEG